MSNDYSALTPALAWVRAGSRVRHPMFGTGIVVGVGLIEKQSTKTPVIVIEFDAPHGLKSLHPEYAPIESMDAGEDQAWESSKFLSRPFEDGKRRLFGRRGDRG